MHAPTRVTPRAACSNSIGLAVELRTCCAGAMRAQQGLGAAQWPQAAAPVIPLGWGVAPGGSPNPGRGGWGMVPAARGAGAAGWPHAQPGAGPHLGPHVGGHAHAPLANGNSMVGGAAAAARSGYLDSGRHLGLQSGAAAFGPASVPAADPSGITRESTFDFVGVRLGPVPDLIAWSAQQ